jgi:hypothetical protein
MLKTIDEQEGRDVSSAFIARLAAHPGASTEDMLEWQQMAHKAY